jgi:hypothetical protein
MRSAYRLMIARTKMPQLYSLLGFAVVLRLALPTRACTAAWPRRTSSFPTSRPSDAGAPSGTAGSCGSRAAAGRDRVHATATGRRPKPPWWRQRLASKRNRPARCMPAGNRRRPPFIG